MIERFDPSRSWAALTVALLAGGAHAATVTLAPELPGQYAPGTGVDGTFLKVADAWHDSSVLWNETTGQYGSGAPIGGFAWGSGIWGVADWQTANQSPAPGMIESAWSGRVSQIGFGNERYNLDYGATWGSVALAPLFTPGAAVPAQTNWTSSFSGYIRIAEAGTYNFSVLHDDGFFFNLGGAGGASLGLINDFLNPRERIAFGYELELAPGLYSFDLGAYDRLEAGVVELSWSVNGGAWATVPAPYLVAEPDVTSVPEAGTVAMWLAGLLTVAGVTRRRAGRRG